MYEVFLQHQFLTDIDKILLLDSGSQIECGKFEQIIKVDNDFVQKIKDTLNEDSKSDKKSKDKKVNDIKIVGENVQENTAETKRSGNVALGDFVGQGI